MLRVTIELLPHGDEPATKTWRGTIANDGSGTRTYGNYIATFFKEDGREDRLEYVAHFPRRHGPWALLAEALQGLRG